VWRDEDGSALVGLMSGSTDDVMADAVECSFAVVSAAFLTFVRKPRIAGRQ
jgi:hypothetical protein